jgi:hypothetical protein
MLLRGRSPHLRPRLRRFQPCPPKRRRFPSCRRIPMCLHLPSCRPIQRRLVPGCHRRQLCPRLPCLCCPPCPCRRCRRCRLHPTVRFLRSRYWSFHRFPSRRRHHRFPGRAGPWNRRRRPSKPRKVRTRQPSAPALASSVSDLATSFCVLSFANGDPSSRRFPASTRNCVLSRFLRNRRVFSRNRRK